MGLDMYLTKNTSVKNWDFQEDKKYTVDARLNGKPISHIKTDRVKNIEEEVIYWRKANQIHNWFVQNVQDGEDNCQESYVSRDQLIELRDTCKKVLDAIELKDGVVKNGERLGEDGWEPILEPGKMIVGGEDVCRELLPSGGGFFFGSTDYDQWYYEQVKDTYEVLNEELKEDHGYSVDYSYRASW